MLEFSNQSTLSCVRSWIGNTGYAHLDNELTAVSVNFPPNVTTCFPASRCTPAMRGRFTSSSRARFRGLSLGGGLSKEIVGPT